jgi:hypothetical protein
MVLGSKWQVAGGKFLTCHLPPATCHPPLENTMSDLRKVVLALFLLVILAFLPGLINWWTLFHSMVMMVIIGVGGVILENAGKRG